MKCCWECGTKLIQKELEHEGLIPFCPTCNTYRFPIFSSAISVIILNEKKDKTLFIKQYKTNKFRLVAGYINKGESAEEALIREVKEELGVDIIEYKLLKTLYYDGSNTLMINFYAVIKDEPNPNYEIDSYSWFDLDEAVNQIKEAKIAARFYDFYLENYKK